MKERKVCLGCGIYPLEGYENYDISPINKTVKFIDLNKFPYDFKDNSIDEIKIFHVIEHLYANRYDVIKELCRILKVGGILKIKLPNYAPFIQHSTFFHGKNYLVHTYQDQDCDSSTIKMFDLIKFEQQTYGGDRLLKLLCKLPFFQRFDIFLYGNLYWELRKL